MRFSSCEDVAGRMCLNHLPGCNEAQLNITTEEIEQHFGAEVARIVQECTDDPDLSAQARKSDQIRTAPYKSREAQQVKLAE